MKRPVRLPSPPSLFGVVCTASLAVLLVVAAFQFSQPLNSDTVTLPIEVFPPDGSSQHSEPVSVDVSDPSGVDRLYIQGHALGYHKSDHADNNGYDQKASFRINGGSWVPIDNDTATCLYPERLYSIRGSTGTTPGCIGGPLHTVRLELPISGTGALVSGDNTIEFRFNGTDGHGSGYRILALELRRGNGSNAIDGTQFVEANYDNWGAPSGGNASNGAQLWAQNNLLVEGPSGRNIVASCANCHARDGSDLKFYNYSNRSIQARSRFHGLTNQQAKDIAAYIRSVDLDLPSGYSVEDAGRPWDPPYQPGPNLENTPVELWGAGAGLEWVLDDEEEAPGTQRDMTTYMIPGGPSDLSQVHPDNAFPVWKQPIAFQLPDWNNWLPDVHPYDVYGKSSWENTGIYKVYDEEIVGRWENAGLLQDDIDQAINDAQSCNQYVRGAAETMRRFTIDRWRNDYESLSKASRFEGSPDPKIDEISDNQWMAVKMWEIHNRYDLQDVAPQMYTPNNDCGRKWGGQNRSWLGNNNSVYNVAPHKNSKPQYPGTSPYADGPQNLFFTSAWYELQMILGPNQGNNDHGNPFDWNYHNPHIDDVESSYGHSQGLRWLRAQIVVQQQKSNYRTFEEGDFDAGWNMHNMQPTRMFWTKNDAPIRNMNQGTRRDVTEAVLRAWLAHTEQIPTSSWPRGSDWGHGDVLPSSYTPQGGTFIGDAGTKADYFYRMMAKAQNLGIAADVVDGLARWGESMWPKANWEQYMCTDCGGSSPDKQTLDLMQGWNLISSRIAPSDAELSTLFGPILSEVVIMKDDNGDTFIPSYDVNSIGDWSAQDGYFLYSASNQSIEFSGRALDVTTDVNLESGWNLVPYYPSSPMSASDAFASLGSSLVVAKDIYGGVYMPSQNLSTIGNLQPGQGYKVYVSQDATLSYPSSGGNAAATVAQTSTGPRQRAAESAVVIVDASTLSDGMTLTARTNDGRTVGRGTVRDGTAVVVIHGDDAYTQELDGATPGDALSLVAASSKTSETETPIQVRSVKDLIRQTPAKTVSYAPDAVLAVEATSQPESVTLEPSSPNPVHSSGELRFSVPSQTNVKLDVYDLLGRRITRLVDEAKPAGWHSVRFDASQLSSGVYFVRLSADGVQQTQKLTVVR